MKKVIERKTPVFTKYALFIVLGLLVLILAFFWGAKLALMDRNGLVVANTITIALLIADIIGIALCVLGFLQKEKWSNGRILLFSFLMVPWIVVLFDGLK